MEALSPIPYDEGRAAEKRGTYITDCPYPDGSDEYSAWHDGYDDSQIAEYLRMEKAGEIR